MMMSEDRRWIVVRDELSLEPDDTGFWFAHTRGNVTLDGGKSAVIEIGGDKIFLCVLGEGSFELMDAKHLNDALVQEAQRDNSDCKKLAIRIDGKTREITVAITPMTDGAIPSELPKIKELSAW